MSRPPRGLSDEARGRRVELKQPCNSNRRSRIVSHHVVSHRPRSRMSRQLGDQLAAALLQRTRAPPERGRHMRRPTRRPFHRLTSEMLDIASFRSRRPDPDICAGPPLRQQRPEIPAHHLMPRHGSSPDGVPIRTALPPVSPFLAAFKEIILRKLPFIVLATFGLSLIVPPAVALNSQSGMPREPGTVRGYCAKVSEGVHIPYRGWHTRNRLGFNTCLRRFT